MTSQCFIYQAIPSLSSLMKKVIFTTYLHPRLCVWGRELQEILCQISLYTQEYPQDSPEYTQGVSQGFSFRALCFISSWRCVRPPYNPPEQLSLFSSFIRWFDSHSCAKIMCFSATYMHLVYRLYINSVCISNLRYVKSWTIYVHIYRHLYEILVHHVLQEIIRFR